MNCICRYGTFSDKDVPGISDTDLNATCLTDDTCSRAHSFKAVNYLKPGKGRLSCVKRFVHNVCKAFFSVRKVLSI